MTEENVLLNEIPQEPSDSLSKPEEEEDGNAVASSKSKSKSRRKTPAQNPMPSQPLKNTQRQHVILPEQSTKNMPVFVPPNLPASNNKQILQNQQQQATFANFPTNFGNPQSFIFSPSNPQGDLFGNASRTQQQPSFNPQQPTFNFNDAAQAFLGFQNLGKRTHEQMMLNNPVQDENFQNLLKKPRISGGNNLPNLPRPAFNIFPQMFSPFFAPPSPAGTNSQPSTPAQNVEQTQRYSSSNENLQTQEQNQFPAQGNNDNITQLDGVGDDEDDDGSGAAEGEEEPDDFADVTLDDDPTHQEDECETENVVWCLGDNLKRNKNRWKCPLVKGFARLNGKDYAFKTGFGEFRWE